MAESSTGIHSLFANLWLDYTSFNPRAKQIYDLILRREREADPAIHELINDHIALRTFNLPQIGLDSLSHIFAKYGYKDRGEYRFEEKKLYARHFEHADDRLPKVFISELEVQKFSPLVQSVAADAAAAVSSQLIATDEFLWSRRGWKAAHSTYRQLLQESEYAAWTYAFGYRANHFTISFNHLRTFRDLSDLNSFVKQNGFALNVSGGEIKGTIKECLEQSSTLAEVAKVEFSDGVFEIPACYYEFARRYPLPSGKLYQGFVAASADKIFESTDVRAKR